MKIAAIIIGVIILMSIFGVAYIYFGVIRPLQGLDIQPGSIQPVSLSPITFQGTIDIKNPGGDTRVPGIDLDLYVDNTLVGSGSIKETVIPAGSSVTVEVNFVSSLGISALRGLLAGKDQVDVKVGGKIHTRPVAIPIPPIPVPIDTTQFLSSINAMEGTPIVGVMEAIDNQLRTNPDMTIMEALDSPEFIADLEEVEGRQISQEEVDRMKMVLEQQGLADLKLQDVANNPELLAALQGFAQ
ncbi:MAG: LEA type 2 family protein [Euryarchaeota archaeon]|nr:LEA type 2 family protein [Euryarchaeota archaeon]